MCAILIPLHDAHNVAPLHVIRRFASMRLPGRQINVYVMRNEKVTVTHNLTQGRWQVLVALLVADTSSWVLCCCCCYHHRQRGSSHLGNTAGSIGERIFPGDYWSSVQILPLTTMYPMPSPRCFRSRKLLSNLWPLRWASRMHQDIFHRNILERFCDAVINNNQHFALFHPDYCTRYLAMPAMHKKCRKM